MLMSTTIIRGLVMLLALQIALMMFQINIQLHLKLRSGGYWSHHGSANIKCPYCFRMFVYKSNLKIHIRDVHSADAGPLLCNKCGKQVKNRSCLRVHMYRNHAQLDDEQGSQKLH
ncbi:hypothetical protein C0J52_03563 [Blattella germanica]|nr:hypothetical protein C0J52_03563 [Blattella germanica]